MSGKKLTETSGRKPDFFDRLMKRGVLKRFEPVYVKRKEVLMYLFFGVCTTLVGYIFYYIPLEIINLPDKEILGITVNLTVQVSNVISWICAVTFAYLTNRTWVFENKASGAAAVTKECADFFAGRLVTLVIENVLMNLMTVSAGIGDMLSKIIVSVVTVILNYIISKLFVFRKKGDV